jgi:hypothetical protein
MEFDVESNGAREIRARDVDPIDILKARAAELIQKKRVVVKEDPNIEDEGDPSSFDYPSTEPPEIRSVESATKPGRGYQP